MISIKKVLNNGWEKAAPSFNDLPFKGNTIVGNDMRIDLHKKISVIW